MLPSPVKSPPPAPHNLPHPHHFNQGYSSSRTAILLPAASLPCRTAWNPGILTVFSSPRVSTQVSQSLRVKLLAHGLVESAVPQMHLRQGTSPSFQDHSAVIAAVFGAAAQCPDPHPEKRRPGLQVLFSSWGFEPLHPASWEDNPRHLSGSWQHLEEVFLQPPNQGWADRAHPCSKPTGTQKLQGWRNNVMTYCSRQGSSQVPISTLLSVMHFSPCRRLRTAPATIKHDPAFPESNLMLCNGHNVSAKSARTVPRGSCPCTSSRETGSMLPFSWGSAKHWV